MTSCCKMFHCLCRGSQTKVINPINSFVELTSKMGVSSIKERIQWKDCKPFVPPISSGEVIKVYDGDTITVAAQLPYPESPIYRFSVRLFGIDAPEIKGKSEEERVAAHVAQQALEGLILHKIVRLENRGQEKYGRILADVYIGEIHINKWLLDNGHAKVYDGGKKEVFVPL